MRGRTQELKKQQLNLEEWQKLYYQNQQSYLRVRLIAIKHLAEGKSRSEVSQLVNCTYKTLSSWIDKYLEGGLEKHHASIAVSTIIDKQIKAEGSVFKTGLGVERGVWGDNY